MAADNSFKIAFEKASEEVCNVFGDQYTLMANSTAHSRQLQIHYS
jgi:hypothetical protein